jgi:acetyl-CoA carboxylase biotin carboxyl carrier protein
MQIQDIKDLMEKMCATGLTVLEFESEGSRLRLEKTGQPYHIHHEMSAADGELHPVWNIQPSAPAPVAEAAEPAKVEIPGHVVTSPVVGIYYSAPSPDSDPFVAVGSTVEVGSPLCIIEAMKLMNEIEAEISGRIVKILVENAQAVEYNQPLFLVEKT